MSTQGDPVDATSWDYIIIGAGSAGCALAYELLKSDGRATVLLLEAGGSDRSPFIKVPAGQIRAVASHDWGYRSQPDPTRNNIAEPWQRGRVLGGSSSINGTMFVRGAARDFDRWAQSLAAGVGSEGASSWSAAAVMPLFREFEHSDNVSNWRGNDGPLRVRTVRHPHALTRAFIHSAQASGYQFNEDYNGATQEGVCYAQLSQGGGLRCSAADAFLKPLAGNRNFKLLLSACVEKIDFSDGRATGVRFTCNGTLRTETARDLIVCAGAINSPKLLLLSGIGAADELRRHQIEVVQDLPGVGLNLKEHPLLRLTYRSRVQTYNLTGGVWQKLGIAARFLRGREGPLANLFEGAAFLRSSARAAFPDIQLHFIPLGYSFRDGQLELTSYPSVSVLLNKSYPLSSGRVRLASRDPGAAPLIECRLLEDQADIDTLVEGIKTIRRIMATQPIAGFIEEEVEPGSAVNGAEALQAYIRSRTGIAYHPVGTCRMGTGVDAVVDPQLRVRGIENLWVADASIMPDLISGNTNAACMMIGAKLGKYLARRPLRTASHADATPYVRNTLT